MIRLMSTKALLFTSIICGTLSTSSCSGYTKELAPLARDLLQNGFELDELQNRALIDGVLVDAFKSGDFDSLEEIAAQFGQKKLATASGVSKLNRFYYAFQDILYISPRDESVRPEIDRLVNEWVKKYPNSATAHVIYAQMLMQRGWSIRGKGYANTVRPENWKPFLHFMEEARIYLNDHEKFRGNDPRWDLALLEIANVQSIPEEQFQVLANAALDRNPDYYQHYFAIMERSLPKWGGSADAVEKFATFAVERTQSTEGYGMYARIYWYAAQSQFNDRLFNSSSVSWKRMKLGIDDVLKRYPDKWNIYNFAMFACFASDEEKAVELLSRISEEKFTQDWPYFDLYDDCKAYAKVK
jgi:hypothetical protein